MKPVRIQVLESFLAKSPRPAMAAAVWDGKSDWFWKAGDAETVENPVFEIGSAGKTFTTALLALLAERGDVALNDPVAKFEPGLPFAETTTLLQLATHTSGLPRNPVSTLRLMRKGARIAEPFQPEDLERFLRKQPRTFRAAGKVLYSNVGMALLGRILGGVCGQSYGEAVRDLLLDPLGMHDTHLTNEAYDAMRCMRGHDARGRPVPPFAWRGMEPAGVWRSTAADMLRFLKVQNGLAGDAWRNRALFCVQPRFSLSRSSRIGLGWFLTASKAVGVCAWHNGGTFGQHAMIAWTPERPCAVVLLTNRVPPFWHHGVPSRQIEALPERIMALR